MMMMMMMMTLSMIMLMTESVVGGLGFTKYLESCVSKIGETAAFECNIQSDGDAPQVSWLVNLLLVYILQVISLYHAYAR